MPWKECSVVEERLRFVARLLDGETMSDLCREFGISIFRAFTRATISALRFTRSISIYRANRSPRSLFSSRH